MLNQDYLDETQLITDNLASIKNKILVISGKGGVGKSTITVNFAAYLAREGFKTSIFDTDVHGPSIPRLLGLQGKGLGQDSEGRAILPEYSSHLNALSLGMILPDEKTSINWRGPKKNAVLRQFLHVTNWGEREFLIIDSPPGTGDEHLCILQSIKDLKGAIIVTTGQEVALTDVRKSIHFCKEVKIPILGIVENMSRLICPHCEKPIDLFDPEGGRRLANEEQLPYFGSLSFDPLATIEADRGVPTIHSKREFRLKAEMEECFAKIFGSLS